MRFIVFVVCALFIMSGITGCLTFPKGKRVVDGDAAVVPLPVSGQVQAAKDEADKEYLLALKYWEHAGRVVGARISSISGHVKKRSAEHLRKGVAYYEKRRGDEALQEFVEALRYDPSNGVALDYLKNRYKADRFESYTVRKGDTFEKIAEAVYGTFTDTFVVAHFSGAERESDLVAGSKLKLPVIDSFHSRALLEYKQDIFEARKLFNGKKFEALLPLSEKILKQHPGDSEASYLVNISLLRIGKKLRSEGKLEEAVRILSRVDPKFKNVKGSIREIGELQRKQLKKDALLVNTELFRKGEAFYERGKYFEALEMFRKVDPEFEGLEKAVSNVREKLKIQADIHYKDGVKFFIGENLAAAISEWEKTLRFDPGHRKAMNYILKARKLLEKFKTIN